MIVLLIKIIQEYGEKKDESKLIERQIGPYLFLKKIQKKKKL